MFSYLPLSAKKSLKKDSFYRYETEKYYFFVHVDGARVIITGKSSSLPSSMAKESTTLEKSEYAAKFEVGPTRPNPGPMLLKQDTHGRLLMVN